MYQNEEERESLGRRLDINSQHNSLLNDYFVKLCLLHNDIIVT
jgi:hypothetical protein